MLQFIARLLGLQPKTPEPQPRKKSSTLLRLQQSCVRTQVEHELRLPAIRARSPR